jgi:hypothetical protein
MNYYDFILTSVYKEMSKVLCRSFGTEISEDIMHDFYTNATSERGENYFEYLVKVGYNEDTIMGAFNWGESSQGHAYWSLVNRTYVYNFNK